MMGDYTQGSVGTHYTSLGIDVFTGSVIINTSKDHNDHAADLFKAVSDKTISNELDSTHLVYSSLGYIPGAYVTHSDSGRLGIIDNVNHSSGGLYDGIRYPIYVNFGSGVYEQSIFLSKYNEIQKYTQDPQLVLKKFADDIQIAVLNNNSEEVKKMQKIQDEMKELPLDQLCDFIDQNTFEDEYMTKYCSFLVNKQIYSIIRDENLKYNIANILFEIHETHKGTARTVLEKTIFNFMSIGKLSCIYDHKLFGVILPDTQEHVIQTLKKQIQEEEGEELLKLYESGKYGENTKKLMRKELETK